jgi:hypothetical protein
VEAGWEESADRSLYNKRRFPACVCCSQVEALTAQVSDLEEAITEATQQSNLATQQLQEVRWLGVLSQRTQLLSCTCLPVLKGGGLVTSADFTAERYPAHNVVSGWLAWLGLVHSSVLSVVHCVYVCVVMGAREVICPHTHPKNWGRCAYLLLTPYTHGLPHADCEDLVACGTLASEGCGSAERYAAWPTCVSCR